MELRTDAGATLLASADTLAGTAPVPAPGQFATATITYAPPAAVGLGNALEIHLVRAGTDQVNYEFRMDGRADALLLAEYARRLRP